MNKDEALLAAKTIDDAIAVLVRMMGDKRAPPTPHQLSHLFSKDGQPSLPDTTIECHHATMMEHQDHYSETHQRLNAIEGYESARWCRIGDSVPPEVLRKLGWQGNHAGDLVAQWIDPRMKHPTKMAVASLTKVHADWAVQFNATEEPRHPIAPLIEAWFDEPQTVAKDTRKDTRILPAVRAITSESLERQRGRLIAGLGPQDASHKSRGNYPSSARPPPATKCRF